MWIQNCAIFFSELVVGKREIQNFMDPKLCHLNFNFLSREKQSLFIRVLWIQNYAIFFSGLLVGKRIIRQLWIQNCAILVSSFLVRRKNHQTIVDPLFIIVSSFFGEYQLERERSIEFCRSKIVPVFFWIISRKQRRI